MCLTYQENRKTAKGANSAPPPKGGVVKVIHPQKGGKKKYINKTMKWSKRRYFDKYSGNFFKKLSLENKIFCGRKKFFVTCSKAMFLKNQIIKKVYC